MAAVLFLLNLPVSWKVSKLCINVFDMIGLTLGEHCLCLSTTTITMRMKRLTSDWPAPCKKKMWRRQAEIGIAMAFIITNKTKRLTSGCQLHISKKKWCWQAWICDRLAFTVTKRVRRLAGGQPAPHKQKWRLQAGIGVARALATGKLDFT